MKSQFVSMVSHELRTPLPSIRGGLQLALQGIDEKSHEDEHALLNAALHSSERLIRLTNDILDMSKFEAGKMQLRLGGTGHIIERHGGTISVQRTPGQGSSFLFWVR